MTCSQFVRMCRARCKCCTRMADQREISLATGTTVLATLLECKIYPSNSRCLVYLLHLPRHHILYVFFIISSPQFYFFFFFNDPAPPEIYPLPLHDALPICGDSHTSTHGALGALAFGIGTSEVEHVLATQTLQQSLPKTMRVDFAGELPFGLSAKDLVLAAIGDRKSTRLNSSHLVISYAVFC